MAIWRRPRTLRTKLERRMRRAARIALYLALAAMVAAAAVVRPLLRSWRGVELDQAWASVDWAAKPEVDLLRRYLRIDTSYTTGNEISGARFLAAELARAGLEPHVEVLGDRHANVWAVLEGDDPQALVLHNHIDTDPLYRPELWRHHPLAADIEPPWLYGRGVFDMKSVAVAQLVAVKRLRESARRPRRSVIFLATGSEEVGSDLGARWVLHRHPELAQRFWAVLTEGGVVEPDTAETVKYWGIETAQKHFLDIHFCSPSRERLERLHWDLRDERRHVSRVRLVPEVAAVLEAYAGSRTRGDYRLLLADFRDLPWDLGRLSRLPPYLQSMFRDEAVPALVWTSPAGEHYLRVALQLLPGSDVEAARAELLPPGLVHDLGQIVVGGGAVSARGSPLDHPAYRTALASVLERYPGAHVGPYFLNESATDARHFRLAGVPAYGFSPFLVFATDTYQVGKANERMALPAYANGVELYADLVKALVH